MPDTITMETIQAMQAMQISMSYSTAVTKMAMEVEEIAAANITKMLPPPMPAGKYIDTYA